ncbi:MAG: DUF2934 domain-containing protein [Bryobacteraceae bacterium]
MIDPKLNEIAPETESKKSGKQVEGGTRAGLSIKETVAGAANLSTGARGVDTSGVSAGAGVGSGMTYSSPTTAGESPSPAIVPGERGSGTTVRGASNAAAPASSMPSTDTEVHSDPRGRSSESDYSFSSEEIASHAYRCWHERGCPEGSPEEDWRRAEEELRNRRTRGANA